MTGNIARAGLLAFVMAAAVPGLAQAGTAYDGSWSLTINTQRGTCDPSYYFQVQITNGIVSHANLVKFRGRVAPSGFVRVSVSAGGKTAAGAGRLRGTAGGGRWTGRSGSDHCSGTWTAQKM
jgi:hypothetical protein